jgi:methylenetetrahydrofolate dehydrogenase (NADP+)/methenyltetrahydrofolate cyclohydrolase
VTNLLLAAPILEKRLQQLQIEVENLKKQSISPKLAVVLVGENPASKVYVGHKKKKCEQIGADCNIIKLDASIQKQAFLSKVESLNQDSSISGIIIQLPLPQQLQDLEVDQLVAPDKDVDGFHFENVKDIYLNRIGSSSLLPCTPKGILTLLDFYNISLTGKLVSIIGRSQIVGKPLSLLLNLKNATTILCHSKTENLIDICRQSDIIIAAAGKAQFLGKEVVHSTKKQVLIDVGIHKLDDGKLVGDLNRSSLEKSPNKNLSITPVPGGVGPLTVLSLLENLIIASRRQGEYAQNNI